MLFQLGPITIDAPAGLNATDTTEEWGSDFAVKPVVGAQQPREFVGAADHRFTLSGKLYPYANARAGQDTGLEAFDVLRGMAGTGEPQLVMRGDFTNLGWFLIEKVTRNDAVLGLAGIGREISYTISLVESPNSGSAGGIQGVLLQLFG